MNTRLSSVEYKATFPYFLPEYYKDKKENIKLLSLNKGGSILLFVTNTNALNIVDFLSREIIFTSTYFNFNEFNILSIWWLDDNETAYVVYKNKICSGYQKIAFNLYDKNLPICQFPSGSLFLDLNNLTFNKENELIFVKDKFGQTYDFTSWHETSKFDIIEVNPIKVKSTGKYLLLVSGSNPFIVNLQTNECLFILDQEKIESKEVESFYVKQSVYENCYYLISKDTYVIFYICLKKDIKETQPELDEQPSRKAQYDCKNTLLECISNKFIIKSYYAANIKTKLPEITDIVFNELKTIMVINSSDRTLRLFYLLDDGTVIYQKLFKDFVTKKKWLSTYFYTFNLKKGIEDTIVTALTDPHGNVEMNFIDLRTLEISETTQPITNTANFFVFHSKNHFTCLYASGKRIYRLLGISTNPWEPYAPEVKFEEDIFTYYEREDYYDDYDRRIIEQIRKEKYREDLIDEVVIESKPEQNLFFHPLIGFNYERDKIKDECIEDLDDLFKCVGKKSNVISYENNNFKDPIIKNLTNNVLNRKIEPTPEEIKYNNLLLRRKMKREAIKKASKAVKKKKY